MHACMHVCICQLIHGSLTWSWNYATQPTAIQHCGTMAYCRRVPPQVAIIVLAIQISAETGKCFKCVTNTSVIDTSKIYVIKILRIYIYFTNWCQCVIFNEAVSYIKGVPCGYPRSSILGPLHYLLVIHIKEVNNVCLQTILLFDAHDVNFFHKKYDSLNFDVHLWSHFPGMI